MASTAAGSPAAIGDVVLTASFQLRIAGAQYGVPALIEFPDQRIAVTDSSQTEGFFNGAFGQYEGVAEARARVDVVAETAHSLWADVTWTYDGGAPAEENIYQLVRVDDAWKIAVLTPLQA